ncbi:hypothetical protein DYU11_09945 [Fibrisoma montanum]|uniref:Uncharacterized protein n=1 Tax=Fibrisoma montanum TaxID=2305895 RepID=A0A418MAE4_9BACT|nr:hypothetical protein [Fibrisoma montanum]RIV23319.1 hypothetical protein DYU11_09945 [Fibrisoma montanum]
MRKRNRTYFLIGLVVLLPFWMWLAWYLMPKRQLVAAIVDKTVLHPDGQEHISLTWILNHQRFTKTKTQPYAIDQDYFGFFPLDNQQYRLKGLERFSDQQLTQLSQDCDLAYYTDTYGIYRQEWFQSQTATERSGIIYGGMSRKDVHFLRQMKQNHKLVIAEFNDINSPTDPAVRNQFESTFGVQWTGWIGRFFDSLDTTVNQELPRWLVRNYKRQHKGQWPFTKAGIVYVSENDAVVVLEEDMHLTRKLPQMLATPVGKSKFGLPEHMRYTYWFDVLSYDPRINNEVASYEIYPTDEGRRELRRYGLPTRFPAILMHDGPDYAFYYFAGDFCDNPVSMSSAYFRGIEWLSPFAYMTEGLTERKGFFWRVYRPMMTQILEDYYRRIRAN